MNPLRRRITVSEVATEISGELVFGTPKSYRSRSVIMPSWLADHLGRHLAIVEPGDLVCTTPRGGPLRTANFRRDVWTPALDTAGIDRELRVHDLRQHSASLRISSGASIEAVSSSEPLS